MAAPDNPYQAVPAVLKETPLQVSSDSSPFGLYLTVALKFEYYLLAVNLTLLAYAMHHYDKLTSITLPVLLLTSIATLILSFALGIATQYIAFNAWRRRIEFTGVEDLQPVVRTIGRTFKIHFWTLVVGIVFLLVMKIANFPGFGQCDATQLKRQSYHLGDLPQRPPHFFDKGSPGSSQHSDGTIPAPSLATSPSATQLSPAPESNL